MIKVGLTRFWLDCVIVAEEEKRLKAEKTADTGRRFLKKKYIELN